MLKLKALFEFKPQLLTVFRNYIFTEVLTTFKVKSMSLSFQKTQAIFVIVLMNKILSVSPDSFIGSSGKIPEKTSVH